MLLLSLLLFCFAYALVGWVLAAHHIIWYIGIFAAALGIFTAWGSSRFLGRWFGYTPQALIITMMVSILITLMLMSSTFVAIFTIPILTAILVWVEMQFLDLKANQALGVLIVLAGLGLALGEFIDLVVLPSARY
ncbi:hypothetical protein [Leptothermofonsia sp. ETS-13]|uniref:hypothetical protein n=1 Tax=Leptothermofonsia sp. ETS-13 TaxID=3035696 RepID=UPI003BA1912A